MTATLPTLSSASATLLAQLLDDPFDYDRRAILSDVLAENSEQLPEVELPRGVKVTRDQWGLPWGVRCTMAEWIGGPCRKCYIRRDGEQTIRDGCNHCNLTGRTDGIARQACERWPVTTVRLSDVNPRAERGFVIEDDLVRILKMPNPPWWQTKEDALNAVSLAAVQYGRSLAGLPPL